MKQVIILLATTLCITLQTSAQKAAVFSTGGKAIRGYDAVAFFNESKAVAGKDSLSYDWSDTKWLFSTNENRKAFMANPTAYAPQYGGYCAYGTAEGHKAPTDTDTWTVVDGKLYFNYNKKVKESWIKDQQGLIKKADANWSLIKDKE